MTQSTTNPSSTSTSTYTLEDMIKELYRVFEEDEVNVEEVHNLMASYKSNPVEWKKYAKFDRYKWVRRLLFFIFYLSFSYTFYLFIYLIIQYFLFAGLLWLMFII